MNLWKLTLAIFVGSGLVGWLDPWWLVAIPPFALAAWQGQSSGKSWAAGFLGVGMLWLLAAAFIHWYSQKLLTTKIAAMFQIPWPFAIVVVTGMLGGLAGGLSSLAGFYFKKAIGIGGKK